MSAGLIAVVAVAAVVVLWALFVFNRLIRLRNEVATGWSNIDVQLKRRADLIPNLVDTVKGYAVHERTVLEAATRARAAVQRAGSPAVASAADETLTRAIGGIFAVSEAYPELKASENFLQLQEELVDAEDKISAARRYYNATVLVYNNAVQTFPSLLIARPLGFRPREFFETTEEARQVVEVTFAQEPVA